MFALIACVLSETINPENKKFIVKRQTDDKKDTQKLSSDRRPASNYEEEKYENKPPKFVHPVPIEDVLGYKPI